MGMDTLKAVVVSFSGAGTLLVARFRQVDAVVNNIAFGGEQQVYVQALIVLGIALFFLLGLLLIPLGAYVERRRRAAGLARPAGRGPSSTSSGDPGPERGRAGTPFPPAHAGPAGRPRRTSAPDQRVRPKSAFSPVGCSRS